MKYAGLSDRGKVRSNNEDCYLLKGGLWAVADGMGGHAAGEVASSLAIRSLEKLPHNSSCTEVFESLVDSFKQANRSIYGRGKDTPEQKGMGTTLTVAALCEQEILIAHIGDSRAYVLRNGALTQITSDHTLVADMLKQGQLEADKVAGSAFRNILTKALGTDETVEPEITRYPMNDVQKLLLCTDGLYTSVDHKNIQDLLAAQDEPASICGHLVSEANAGGGRDNITVVVVDFS